MSDIFETMKNHLLTQNQRSSEGGHCRHRGPSGLKCAVGVLIADEHYNAALEGQSVSSLNVRNMVTRSLGFAPDWALLDQVQTIHDNYEPSRWAQLLGEIQ
ncbi:MAG: hypothetical protein ACK4VZ_13745 [Paracoccaceae bacterium]